MKMMNATELLKERFLGGQFKLKSFLPILSH